MTIDGAFSTAWLKNLQKPMGSVVLSQDNGSGSSSNAYQFCAQPTSIPGSVLQLLGSSYLLRATAWELYGRYIVSGHDLALSHFSSYLSIFALVPLIIVLKHTH